MTPRQGRDLCAIAGIAQTRFTRDSGTTELALACEAIKAALNDAGLNLKDVDGMMRFSADSNSEVMLVSALGLDNLRFFGEIGNGGSGALIGHGALAIQARLAEVVVCFRALNGASKPHRHTAASAESRTAFEDRFGLHTAVQRYALVARRHMIEYGSTCRQFGAVAVAQRAHAQRNPHALMFGHPLTLEEHQSSPWACQPLRLYDCALRVDGAAAVVLVAAQRARNLAQRPVYVMATAQSTGPTPGDTLYRPSLAVSEASLAANDLYGRAGVCANDVDVAEFYDHFSPFVIYALEAFGFCGPGEGGPFVEEGRTLWPTGELPVNTHGGNLSEGYMHGLSHVVEATHQLRGTASCQVVNGELALVGSAFGQVSSAVLLRR